MTIRYEAHFAAIYNFDSIFHLVRLLSEDAQIYRGIACNAMGATKLEISVIVQPSCAA